MRIFAYSTLLILGLSLLLLTMFSSPVYAAPDWRIIPIHSAGGTGEFTSLAIDSNDIPHISHYRSADDELRYTTITTKDGESIWTTKFFSDMLPPGGGKYSSIAVDSSINSPRISYYEEGRDLRLAYKEGSSWQIEWCCEPPINEVWLGAISTDIEITNAHNPSILYHDYDSRKLKISTLNLEFRTWSTDTILYVYLAEYVSMELDAADNPHISYTEITGSGDKIQYITKSGTVWNTPETVATSELGANVVYSSIALDSSGNPHISFFDSTTDELFYASKDTGGWNIETVDSGILAQYTSLVLDSNDNPHISYYNYLETNLKYATKTAGVWNSESIDDTDDDVGKFTSIALDSCGNPHISYYDESNNELKYAYKGKCVKFPIDLTWWERFLGTIVCVQAPCPCFVAKAAYGSELAPVVQQLREFRDNEVLTTDSGTAIMNTVHKYYYAFSPTIANWEDENPMFKELVRLAITPGLATFSILSFVDVDSESKLIFYITSIVLLNLGMYFVAPAIIFIKITGKFKKCKKY